MENTTSKEIIFFNSQLNYVPSYISITKSEFRRFFLSVISTKILVKLFFTPN